MDEDCSGDMVNFTETTECNGVYHDQNYRMVSSRNGDITFSYARKGQAMTVHFASNTKGLRYVKIEFNRFCKWLFDKYHCALIYGIVDKKKPGVMRLIQKVGFVYLTDDNRSKIFVRMPWALL